MTSEQLKASILQYAMKGKLVPQKADEEPASELLKRIKLEKEQMIAEGKIKKEKELPEITDEEIPFDIPSTWEWVRLGNLSSYIQRGKSPKYVDFSAYRVISQKCIQWYGFNIEPARFISKSFIEEIDSIRIVRNNDILWNSTGTGTVGRLLKINNESIKNYQPLVVDSHVTIVRMLDTIEADYIKYYLMSPEIQENIEKITTGSTKQKELNRTTILNLPIPLPSLEEQLRIVEKIDELLPLIEEYGDVYTELEKLNADFPKKMEQSLLQYAMEGKLVPQISSEEPAKKLLKRIHKEKEELIAEGKIKKEKVLPAITEEEKPFDIPDTWEWVRLEEIVTLISGRDLTTAEYTDSKKNESIPYITGASNFEHGSLTINRWTMTPRVFANKGDLLITVKGTIGDMAILNESEVHIARQVNAIRITDSLNLDFIKLYMSFSIPEIRAKAKSLIPGVSRTDILELKVPLPPIEEQKRIVNAFEEGINIVISESLKKL